MGAIFTCLKNTFQRHFGKLYARISHIFAEYSRYSATIKLPPSLNILHIQTQQIVPHACQQTVCQLQQSTLSPLKFHNSATHTSLFYTTHSKILQRINRQTYGQIHRARLSAVIVSWLNIHLLRLHLFPFRGRIYIRRHSKSAPTAANNLLFRCKQTTITLLTT
ncbi:hypothetical protein [Prevotella pallens]|uniref:hypothetical protein n=1 Tax=Prevotella pallens TaxID=60133 RepID=UPI001CB3A735|nr:hypothetical protein [Prevotella pallens]MBF1459515.1 hypothetical protein [Prevotella pallens]